MSKTIVKNKSLNYEYEVIETFMAGLQLEGWMVKSIRAGKISASDGAYVTFKNGEAFLDGLHIKKLIQSGGQRDHESDQPTLKLLLQEKEIAKLIGAQKEKGQTIVLKSLFWKGHLVKADICLAKGKKNHDKRQTIKERDMKLEADRAMKNAR